MMLALQLTTLFAAVTALAVACYQAGYKRGVVDGATRMARMNDDR